MFTLTLIVWLAVGLLVLWCVPVGWQRRIVVGMVLCMALGTFVSGVLAQDATAAEKPSIWYLLFEALLKTLPTVLSFFSSYLTQGLQYVHGRIPQKLLAPISGVVGVLVSALSAVFLGAPAEQVEAYSGTGLLAGLAGHAVKQSAPIAKPTS